MSTLIKPYRKLTDPSKGGLASKVPGGKVLYKTELSHYAADSVTPPMPAVPEVPRAPTIDDAQRTRNEQDRLRRRRGVLANIYGGASGSSATGGSAPLGS